MFPLTRPTLFFVPILQFFFAFQKKKIKKIFIPTDPKMFQKIRQNEKEKEISTAYYIPPANNWSIKKTAKCTKLSFCQ